MLGKKYIVKGSEEDAKTRDRIIVETTKLFASKGYGTSSIREIAKIIGIQPGSIYSHFDGKEELFEAILDQISDLYKAYFLRLENANKTAKNIDEIVDNMFVELEDVVNIHIFYGINLILRERYRSEKAYQVYSEILIGKGIENIKKYFDDYIDKGVIPSFDTKTVAIMFFSTVLLGNDLRVNEALGYENPINPNEMFESIHELLKKLVKTAIQ